MALTGTVNSNYTTLLNGTNTDLGSIFTNVYGQSSRQFIIGSKNISFSSGIGSNNGTYFNFTVTIPDGATPTLGILNWSNTKVNNTAVSPYFSLSFNSLTNSGTTCTINAMIVNSSGNYYGNGTPISGNVYYILI